MLLSAMNSYPEMNGENGVSNGDVEMESLTPAASAPAAATIDDLLLANDMHADKTEVLMAKTEVLMAKTEGNVTTIAAANPGVKYDVKMNGTKSNYSCSSRSSSSSSSSTDEHSYCIHDAEEDDSSVKINRKKNDANVSDYSDDEDVVAATVNGLREHVAQLAANCDDEAKLIAIDDNTIVNSTSSCHDEDCDILSNRETSENSEDCCKIVDEIEIRLNGENSVQSSVETIIDNNFSTNSELSDYKYVSDVLQANHQNYWSTTIPNETTIQKLFAHLLSTLNAVFRLSEISRLKFFRCG